ncbi:hypothetical protein M1116_01660 [Patescibacteria group bacterium]|nr:hypothetical protein [Patescibacteria group bacterium]
MIFVYAFSNQWGTNISLRTLIDLQDELKNYPEILYQKIDQYPQSFFDEFLRNKTYSAIIGLGDLTGSFDKIKIETQAANLYGRHSIIPLADPVLKLDLPLLEKVDRDTFIFGQNMGTYNCNWLAYQIQSLINQKKLTTLHLFFHLPRDSVSKNNAKGIANLLIENGVLQ